MWGKGGKEKEEGKKGKKKRREEDNVLIVQKYKRQTKLLQGSRLQRKEA